MEGEDDVQSSALEFIFEPILSALDDPITAMTTAAKEVSERQLALVCVSLVPLMPVQLSWSALLLAARKQEKAEADDGRRAAARDA